jgi:hypothetical protein
MIISQRQITSLTEELQTLISKKETAVRSAIRIFNSWKDIVNHIKTLLSSISRAKTMILNDEKELNDIKSKCKDFSRLSQIDTNDPGSEKWAITFVEIQAIISSNTQSPTTNLIELIQTNIKKLKQALDNSNERKNAVHQRVTTAGNSAERIPSKNFIEKRKYSESKEKYLDFNNEALIKEVTAGKNCKLELSRRTPECKDYSKLHINARGQSTKALKLTSSSNALVNEIFTKTVVDQNARHIPQTKLVPRPNIDPQKRRVMCLTNFNFTSKHVMEALSILTEETKSCSVCNERNHSMIALRCCGKMCVKCLRKKLIESEPRILLNVFESEKKQSSICACPIHKTIITIEQLLSLFTHKEIERISIEALKRERKVKNGTAKPSLCIDCKEVIEDDIEAMRVCAKHKVCKGCYKKCNKGNCYLCFDTATSLNHL